VIRGSLRDKIGRQGCSKGRRCVTDRIKSSGSGSKGEGSVIVNPASPPSTEPGVFWGSGIFPYGNIGSIRGGWGKSA
jgi:hypothetical protein